MNWDKLKKGKHFIFNSCCDPAIRNTFAINGIEYIDLDVSLRNNWLFIRSLSDNNENIIFHRQTKSYKESKRQAGGMNPYDVNYLYKTNGNYLFRIQGCVYELKEQVILNKKILVF